MQNDSTDKNTSPRRDNFFARSITRLVQMGLGESLLRVSTNLFSIIAIGTVILLVQIFYRPANPLLKSATDVPAVVAASANMNPLPQQNDLALGISRAAQIHTNAPSRPRQDIAEYVVQDGDTVFGIAEKFGLEPKTIFAANYAVLQDDPHSLLPKQSLKILPVDGVYWEWLGGIPFGDWAAYFKVKPEDIINFPANNIDAATISDAANANIKVGTWLIIPNGEYQYHTPGQVPLGMTRSNPASAQVGGAGACPAMTGGVGGTGTFIFPSVQHVLSGFDYSEKTNHLGIDLAGNLGDSVFATDGGVIVYAGVNGYGYGNMIMIDHGTGFQSLYAHLSQIFVSCGESVNQGQTIGAIGSTGHSSGPHLHFEVRTSTTVINPWNVLP